MNHKLQPRYTHCPRRYCLYYLGKESGFEKQTGDGLERVMITTPIMQSECGLSSPFGACQRLDPQAEYDAYEPCDPLLKREGIERDYFVNPTALTPREKLQLDRNRGQ